MQELVRSKKDSSMVKNILKALGVLIALLLAALLIISLTLGNIVEKAVNAEGPKAIGVPVSVTDIKLNPFSGDAVVENLVIGNPEKFKSDSLFEMDSFDVGVDVASLFSDTLVIRNIELARPVITYEITMDGSNIGALTRRLKIKTAKDEQEEEKEEPQKKAPAKKIVINRLVLSDARVRVLAPGLSDPLKVEVAKLELTDIGKKGEGVPIDQAWLAIMQAIGEAVAKSVSDSGEISALHRKITDQMEEMGSDLSREMDKLGSSLTNEAGKLGVDPDKAIDEINKLLR